MEKLPPIATKLFAHWYWTRGDSCYVYAHARTHIVIIIALTFKTNAYVFKQSRGTQSHKRI